MKPKNFPARKLLRKMGPERRADPRPDQVIEIETLRAVRTKKRRGQ